MGLLNRAKRDCFLPAVSQEPFLKRHFLCGFSNDLLSVQSPSGEESLRRFQVRVASTVEGVFLSINTTFCNSIAHGSCGLRPSGRADERSG